MHTISARAVLCYAVCGGVLAGVGESLAFAVEHFALGRWVFVGLHVVWLSPLGNALIALALAGVVLLLRLALPALRTRHATLMILGAVPLFAVALHVPQVHWAAWLLLSLGVAHQVARRATERVDALAGKAAAGLALGVLLLALGMLGGQRFAEGRALAQTPAQGPNVLLIVMDTVRARSTSLHGYSRATTPALEALAKQGTRFDMALAPTSWTLPSHGGMFTGRTPAELSTNWNVALDGAHPTLAEVLTRRGYRTGAFVANPIYGSREFGLARGFARYEDYVPSVAEMFYCTIIARRLSATLTVRHALRMPRPLAQRDADDINASLLSWLGDDRRPFFAFVNYFDAHHPYVPPAPFDGKFVRSGGARPDLSFWTVERRFAHPGFIYDEPPEALPAHIDGYDGAIAYVDDRIGKLLAELKRRGVLQNTLVIVTSDHGEQFLEHGHYTHGVSQYLEETHVPLVIALPGTVPVGAVARPVTLCDLPATVLALLGAKNELPGSSLFGERSSPALTQWGGPWNMQKNLPFDQHALILEGHRVIFGRSGKVELYNLEEDPLEQRNIAETPEGAAVLARIGKALDEILATRGK